MPEVFKSGEEEQKQGKVEAKELVAEVLRRVGETPRKAVGSSYIVCPGRRFMSEQADEEVVLLLRAHPITNIKWIVSTILLIVILQIILLLNMFVGIPGNFIFIARIVVYLLAIGYVLENFLRWYYSVLIITNERIVDVDFINLLHRHIAYAALNHIEQPSLSSGGVVRSFFNFGDIKVETAAEDSQVEISDVPHPDRVLRIISELSEELEKRRERGE